MKSQRKDRQQNRNQNQCNQAEDILRPVILILVALAVNIAQIAPRAAPSQKAKMTPITKGVGKSNVVSNICDYFKNDSMSRSISNG